MENGLITFFISTITGIVTFFIGQKKAKAEVDSIALDNLEKSINIYKTIIDDLKNEISQLNKKIDHLENKLEEMKKQYANT